MKKLLNILMLIFICYHSNAQQMYYYYNGNKINLIQNYRYLNVQVASNYNFPSDVNNYEFSTLYSQEGEPSYKILKFFIKNTNVNYYNTLLNTLRSNTNVQNISFYFERGNNAQPLGTSNFFYVKTKNNTTSYQKLIEYSSTYNYNVVSQVPNMENWYIVKLNNFNNDNVLNVSSKLYETNNFEAIDPAFMFKFNETCVNDPMFNQLWGLQNSNGNDIKMCNAWNIALGNNINVAVVDHGIDNNHPDLSANISPLCYNTITGTATRGNIDFHGTHIAGTIGAVRNNNIGVAGVAPNCRLVSISHPLTVTSTISAQLASGITWASQFNRAQVLSCSWGDQGGALYNNLHSTILENAITNAINNGRNGLGAIVVFAAGNKSPAMDYPATFNPQILTVASIASNGIKSSFSGYGSNLDVVAPGQDIRSTFPNNQYSTISGTSMATPHVSGLAALILSMNNNYTGRQVRDIIERNTTKLSSYTFSPTGGRTNGNWNNEVGYGLINAFSAVREVQIELQYITQLNACTPLNLNNLTNTSTLNYNNCVINSKNTKIQSGTTNFNATLETNLFENFEVTGGNFEIKGP